MSEQEYWKKKFSIGLALNMSEHELKSILDEYTSYIDNVYLSPPLGDRFHGREQIAAQFRQPENIEKFWRMAAAIQSYGISLEIVFNTDKLKRDDIGNCRKLFDEHHIRISKVAVLDCIDWYYEEAREHFPEAQIVHSVNNMPDSPDGYLSLKHKYDEIVIGRNLIRNKRAGENIHKAGAKSVLLLNNGCSFFCGGCREPAYCKKVYERTEMKYDPEYIYALQSILPYEIHENFFETEQIDYFKLSTRNGDADYIKKCLDSYIHNNGKAYIQEGYKNYLLWGRLAWHIPHYAEFDYDRIKEKKKEICKIMV